MDFNVLHHTIWTQKREGILKISKVIVFSQDALFNLGNSPKVKQLNLSLLKQKQAIFSSFSCVSLLGYLNNVSTLGSKIIKGEYSCSINEERPGRQGRGGNRWLGAPWGLGAAYTLLEEPLQTPISHQSIRSSCVLQGLRKQKQKLAGLWNGVGWAASSPESPHGRSTPSCPSPPNKQTNKPKPGSVWPFLLSCSRLSTFCRRRLTVMQFGGAPVAPPGAPPLPCPR